MNAEFAFINPRNAWSGFQHQSFINTPYRVVGAEEYRWIDLGVEIRDVKFLRFLIDDCRADDRLCLEGNRDALRELIAPREFLAVGEKREVDVQHVIDAICNTDDQNQRKNLFKVFAEWQPKEHFPADFGIFATFDINAPIFTKNGRPYGWLDFAAEINDYDLATFLLKNNIDTVRSHNETKEKFASQISEINTLHEQNQRTEERRVRLTQQLEETQAQLRALDNPPAGELAVVQNPELELELELELEPINQLLPGNAGAPVNADQVGGNAQRAAAQNGNSTLYKVGKLFLCSPLIAAGAVLYVTPMVFNAVISTAYITAQGFASIGALPAYAIDKTIWAGINLVRTNVFHYEKADTRYYFTKTIGGAACVMGLVAVALCTNNPVSIGLRRVFLSGPAYLGASLISWSCHSSPIDERGYDAILADYNARFETSQPDMQWKNWEKIMIFTAKLATNRGFKESYHNTFHNPAAPLGDDQAAAPNPDYPGFIRGTLASFAMRIYP